MEVSGVRWGFMDGKSDWKTDVVRVSRCLGMALEGAVESVAGVVKLFMTSWRMRLLVFALGQRRQTSIPMAV